MRILLLRPPRFLWPFNSETSAFWQPLGFSSLAGAVRAAMPDANVEIWDCPASRTGWQTLRRRLAETPIDVLGIGEETVSADEGLRAAALAKQAHPGCLVVAGGVYYAHAIAETLSSGLVDVIVRGEGERTFVEWLAAASDRGRWPAVAGIAFRDAAGQVVQTPPRPLIDDLDALPRPAWDLLDMSQYGRNSRNHPALASIEHSRGCVDRCSFCILWKHMGEYRKVEGRSAKDKGSGPEMNERRASDFRPSHFDRRPLPAPRYRTKSPQRSFDEICELYHRFGRRTFGWVDPTFNASSEWSDGFAELVLGSDLMHQSNRPACLAASQARTLHTAWLRADGVVRDEKLGVLEKLVRAGLRQVMIGVERDDQAGLEYLDKHHNDAEICRQAFAIFREKYPQVYTIGTMIFGLPGDTAADIARLVRRQYEFGMDYCFLMPLTPNPGTAVREAALADGRLANADLASYNFHTPVLRTDALGLRELERSYYKLMFRPDRPRIARLLRQVFFEPDRRKRSVYRALLGRGTAIAIKSLAHRIVRPGDSQPTLYSRKPSWYDS